MLSPFFLLSFLLPLLTALSLSSPSSFFLLPLLTALSLSSPSSFFLLPLLTALSLSLLLLLSSSAGRLLLSFLSSSSSLPLRPTCSLVSLEISSDFFSLLSQNLW
ncbi:hypothetical protein ACOSQ3_017167 [Xanthoceras sorbifolium]